MKLIAALALAGFLYAGTLDVLKRTPKGKYIVYVASKGHGIAAFRVDPEGPTFEALTTEAKVPNPTWLVVHPSNQLIYALSDDSLTAFATNAKTGALRFMNTVPSRGSGGCHLALDKNGWMLLATNCSSGSVASFRTAGDGGIGPSVDLRETGHARQAVITPDNFFIFVPDTGGKIFNFRSNVSAAQFWPNDPASFTAKAAQMTFRPDEKFAYATDEKAISVLRYDRFAGKHTEVVATVPSKATAIVVDSSGRFAYTSGKEVTVFSIDGKRGTLKQVQQLAQAGLVRIDPTGRYLFIANEASNSVAVFEIDHKTGMLAPSGKPLDVPSPVCVAFVASS